LLLDEVQISDDGSSDRTMEQIRIWQKKKVYVILKIPDIILHRTTGISTMGIPMLLIEGYVRI